MAKQLPIPPWFDRNTVGKIQQVDYETLAQQAYGWQKKHNLTAAAKDRTKVCVVPVDTQIDFCSPEGKLFVGGRSGNGAVEDNIRFVEFLYREMANISLIAPTFDTHQAFQIFYAHFLVNDAGEHPPIFSNIKANDIRNGVWKANPGLTWSLDWSYSSIQSHLLYYVEQLEAAGKYELTIWPYHTMLGGVGHALDPAIAEALHVHSLARNSQWQPKMKGGMYLTENYSVMCPEVTTTFGGKPIAQRNVELLELLATFDVVAITGQAKSHCVAWTIDDFLGWLKAKDPRLVEKVYLIEDCTSPVVTPFMDYTADADAAFKKFADAGMHIVQSTTPMEQWPGVNL